MDGDPLLDEMAAVLDALIAFLDDSFDGAIGYGRDTVYVRGISDVEIKPDGSMRLSDARATLREYRKRAAPHLSPKDKDGNDGTT